VTSAGGESWKGRRPCQKALTAGGSCADLTRSHLTRFGRERGFGSCRFRARLAAFTRQPQLREPVRSDIALTVFSVPHSQRHRHQL
jgi:hypothetical protein